MNQAQFEQLTELAAERDAKRYAWLRHLLLLAAGVLTLLVSLKAGSRAASMFGLWALRLAWVTLGLGILSLAVALHAEVWTSAELTKRLAEQLAGKASPSAVTAVRRPAIYRRAERLAYAALATAVFALVAYGVSQP